MNMSNKSYNERAHRYIPGGAHTYSRGDDQYPANAPSVLTKGEGAYVWDAEGNKYLDYGMALRAVTMGYGYRRISEAAINQIRLGNSFTRPSAIEVDTAEKLVNLIDGMDMVKFAKNGSTVTTAATKLARHYTGKKYIARCLEHPFFSYDDWFIGDTEVSSGVPDEVKSLTLNFSFNNIASLQNLFDNYAHEIACVILEPATYMEPDEGFLHGVKSICKKYGAVFILDEMITGFRWDIKGAQKFYGVEPDLCTFGKGMANGFSMAALMGKKELMELGGIYHEKERIFLISTTNGAEMSSLGALNETIDVYKELDVTKHFWQYGKRLCEGINNISKDMGLLDYLRVDGVYVNPLIVTNDKQKKSSLDYKTLFMQEMIKQGVLMPWIALSHSHGDRELEITLEAVRASLKIYRNALDGNISDFLLGPSVKPVFRKYN